MQSYTPSDFSILMVDDNPKNLQLLGANLRNEGYKIEFATNGKMALSWVEKRIFDLILLDIMMPEMSGYEVCQKIRLKPEYNDVPIIFLTAKVEKESVVHGFKLGAQDYITKPFDIAELMARVNTHLDLRYHRKKLLEVNANLEKIVQERTMELQHANKQLSLANDELMKLEKAKAEFLHIIAHEIRTPLNGIKGSVQIMRDLNETAPLGNLFKILDESVSRLEKFSIIALKITQLKTGSYELDMQEIPVKLLFDKIFAHFAKQINQKKINWKIEKCDSCQIWGDNELVSNALISVYDNAVKFSPNEGTIETIIEVMDGKIKFSVIDSGPGFSEQAMRTLYRLFSPGVKHVNENEGIELAMVKMIMEVHKGDVKIANGEHGAIVILEFPIFDFYKK